MNTQKQAASGCLFGLALGDALGAPTEFMSFERIVSVYGTMGPTEPTGAPALVTDDTQMALAVGEALAEARGRYTAQTLEPLLREGFVAWMNSPDNNRAPGNTCLQACHALERMPQGPWQRATVAGSKGCGANMRVAPVGLLPVDERTRAGVAQFQAALTHGHPTALAASDLTAFAVSDFASGGEPQTLPARLRRYAHAQRTVYHDNYLGSLWERPGATTPQNFIARGWDECLAVLDRLDAALARPDRDGDPCLATGEGWIAEEAFATGILCFLLFPNDPVAAVRRGAASSGDSDSIACLAGAFAGAYHGLEAWPTDWLARIEYRDRLARLTALWD